MSNSETSPNFANDHPAETNPGFVETHKGSLEQKIESLGKEIKSLRKQNKLNGGIIKLGVIGLIGYVVAINWSAIAPALAVATPTVGVVIGAVVGAAVLIGASYAMWKYRAGIERTFERAAENAVKGAKYTAEKTVKGAKDLYGRAKKVVDSVTYYDHDHQDAFLKRMSEFTPENNKNYEEIREQLKVISNEKDGSVLLKNVLSEIGSMIDSKIANEGKPADTDQSKAADKLVSEATKEKPANTNQSEADKLLLSEWKEQKNFVKGLDSQKLKNLVNNKGLPSDYYMINKVFSEHYSEIKEIIRKCGAEHKLSKFLKNLSKVAKSMVEE